MSVRKRTWTTKAGIKEAWIMNYTDSEGKRRLKTFDRKKDAEAAERGIENEKEEGTHVPESKSISIKEAGELWLTRGKLDGLERTTLDQRKQHLKEHINPYLGNLLLSKLTLPAVTKFQDRLRTEAHGSKKQVCTSDMVRRVTISLGSILSNAIRAGYAARNVVKDTTHTRTSSERRRKAKLQVGKDIPTREEIRLIVEHATNRYRPLLITAIFTGLRASELRGLRWQDVDLANARLHVRQRADRYHGKKHEGDHNPLGLPKSEAGQRSVPLAPLVVNTLKEWKLKCPKGAMDLVFPNAKGNIEFHTNIIHRGLWPAQMAAGVTVDTGERDKEGRPILKPKYPGLHSLRHFYASWCINRRADGGLELSAKMVQERMGHSSVTVTLDTYSHLFPSQDDAEALAEAEKALLGGLRTI